MVAGSRGRGKAPAAGAGGWCGRGKSVLRAWSEQLYAVL
eukprot:SAG11_NODE_30324_length_302_cov_0.581281_1_plen_38_part_01